jgi:hypothetical protein
MLTLSLHISKSAEQTFVAEGHGVKRYPVMYNDFVLIGPEGDPAGIRGMKDVAKALKAIKDKSATFISRGDNSGTHMRELMLWNKDVGINIQELDGPWYKPIERGMNAHAPIARAHRRLCTLRPRHLDFFQKQGRPSNLGGRRPTHVQSVRRHSGEPRQTSEGAKRVGPDVHQLADIA